MMHTLRRSIMGIMADPCVLLRSFVLDGLNRLTDRFRYFGQRFPFFVEMIQILIFVLVAGLTGVGHLRIIERIFRQ